MKVWSLAVAAVLAGIALGLASSFGRLTYYTGELNPYAAEAPGTTSSATRRSQPKAEVVNGSEYDFGVMELLTSQSHEFRIHNVGDAPLRISTEGTTCKCTISELPDDEVSPGGDVTVTLEWKASQEGEFRQSADLHTNDPTRPHLRLTVTGYVVQTFQALPDEIVLGRISSRTPAKANIRLYSTRDNFEIESSTFADAETAEFFDVDVRPLGPGELEEFGPWKPKSGKLVEIHIKPGLPYGALQQTIRLTMDVADAAPLAIPVQATVVTDISIIGGSKFVDDLGLLRLGLVKSAIGTSEQLHVLVKGSDRERVEVRVAEVDPADGLQATLGTPQNSGAVLIYPLTISVPPGAPALTRLGKNGGRVVLETTHPEVEQIEIIVHFAVEAPTGT